MVSRPPQWGEPAPFITAVTDGVANYSIQVAAGRWMVLMAFGSLSSPICAAAHDQVLQRRDLFDDANCLFFGVTVDIDDRNLRNLYNDTPGLRYLWDLDHKACRTLGVISDEFMNPMVFLIDRSYRIFATGGIDQTGEILDLLEHELAQERQGHEAEFAPVLLAPRIFEPEFCQTLIDYFNAHEAEESGFAIDMEGKTVIQIAAHLKRREDVTIEDEALIDGVAERMTRRLLPMVERAFGWRATEIERFLICRYSDHNQGFFTAHRDNVTAGTAHRKFAVSINLNEPEFEGGEVRFPEFGPRTYRSPTGGAAVFACGLLHDVTPVTRGVRYTLVPFLYDDEGVAIRNANVGLVEGEDMVGRRVQWG